MGTKLRSLLRPGAALAVAALSGIGITAPLPGAPDASAAPAQSASYTAIQPCRLVDTRSNLGTNVIAANTLLVKTKGVCNVPNGATALSVTLTIADPVAAGFLTAWPADQAQPVVSSLNFTTGQQRANGSIVRVDADGQFKVFTNVPTAVIVDVVGAFLPATSAKAGRLTPVSPPTRVFDSRKTTKLAVNSSITLPLPGGVPSDAIALALNVTITESNGAGFVSEYPAGTERPNSSILNVDGVNQTRAAAGIFPVSPSGFTLYVSGGAHIVVDIFGYFTGPSASSSADGLYTAYDPARLLDTRGPSPLGSGVPLYAQGGVEVPASGGGTLAYNITSVNGDAGYLTTYPAGTAIPNTSTVNSVGGGDTVANFSITQVSDRGLGIFAQSQGHVLVDLQGWFSGPKATVTNPVPPSNNPPGGGGGGGGNTGTDGAGSKTDPAPPGVGSKGETYAACTHGNIDTINNRRAQAGVAPLVRNVLAETFACQWAIKMAQDFSTKGTAALAHSLPADRNNWIYSPAAQAPPTQCGVGENVAFSTGTDPALLFDLWFKSPPHLANILDADYKMAGNAFVVRTESDGQVTIWGVTEFGIC
jgi:uncharacterized protein YkwD